MVVWRWQFVFWEIPGEECVRTNQLFHLGLWIWMYCLLLAFWVWQWSYNSNSGCLSRPDTQIRGWAEQKQRISIPVPALPVQEFWQGKSRKICNSLNGFKGVTFTFWIKMHRKNIFPKINSKNYKFSVFFPARIPVPAMPEPESKFFVSVPLTH